MDALTRGGKGVDASHVEFSPYDVVDFLHDEDDIRGYLEAVAEFDEPGLLAAAAKDAARARTVNGITQATGLDRQVVCAFFAPTRESTSELPSAPEPAITPDQITTIAQAVMQVPAD